MAAANTLTSIEASSERIAPIPMPRLSSEVAAWSGVRASSMPSSSAICAIRPAAIERISRWRLTSSRATNGLCRAAAANSTSSAVYRGLPTLRRAHSTKASMRLSRSVWALNASTMPSICSACMLSSTARHSSSLPAKFE